MIRPFLAGSLLVAALWQGTPQQHQAQAHDAKCEGRKIADKKDGPAQQWMQPKEQSAETQIFNYESKGEQKKAEFQSYVNGLGLHITSDWVMVALTLALVALTFAYVCVAFWQVRTSHNTERAWITIQPGWRCPELRPIWEQSDQVPEDGRLEPFVHMFRAIVRNVGRTPAKIDEIAIRYELLNRLSDLRETPDYEKKIPKIDFFLVPK